MHDKVKGRSRRDIPSVNRMLDALGQIDIVHDNGVYDGNPHPRQLHPTAQHQQVRMVLYKPHDDECRYDNNKIA